MSVQLTGIGVSRGIAIGKAHVLRRGELEILEYAIPEHLVEDEVQRFRRAVEAARAQLREVRERIPQRTRADIVEFINTHLLMLEDSTLTAAPEQFIRSQHCNAEWALKLQRDALVQVFEEMDDAYLRTRKDDIDHVVNRIQRILLNEEQDGHIEPTDGRLQGCVVLADDLTPADTVLMQHQGILAFVTEYGGPLSHTAIIARSLRLPAVVGVHNVRRYVRDNETLIVDGRRGVIIAGADEAMLDYYRSLQAEEARRAAELKRLKGKPAVTEDGRIIHLLANIELPEDIDDVLQVQAEGVGLYRTEYLFMNREDTPSEDEQFEQFEAIISELDGLPLTIRTLDLGADKQVDGANPTGRLCSNPALGLRAVRLCLKNLSLFRPQLRAILRASALGPVRMMIPMLSNIQELFQVLQLVRETRNELETDGYAFDPAMPVGGMIEVPAAALAAEQFAAHLDFLSIGTNDLIQYTLAIDRIDDEVNYLYDPLHPAVLFLIHRVIEAGRRRGVPVSMCGEMAGDTRYTRLLLGLGLTEFSMQPLALLEVKSIINSSNAAELATRVAALLGATDPQENAGLLEELLEHEA